ELERFVSESAFDHFEVPRFIGAVKGGDWVLAAWRYVEDAESYFKPTPDDLRVLTCAVAEIASISPSQIGRLWTPREEYGISPMISRLPMMVASAPYNDELLDSVERVEKYSDLEREIISVLSASEHRVLCHGQVRASARVLRDSDRALIFD